MNSKRRYCVIVYVGHFGPPNFGPISVRSLLYMMKYLILLQYISSAFHCWLSTFVAMGSAHAVRTLGGGGWGHTGSKTYFADARAELF